MPEINSQQKSVIKRQEPFHGARPYAPPFQVARRVSARMARIILLLLTQDCRGAILHTWCLKGAIHGCMAWNRLFTFPLSESMPATICHIDS